MRAEDFARRLDGRRSGRNWSARCPAHDDRQASLSISDGNDGRLLVHCHAGCKTSDVLAAMNLTDADMFAEKPTRTGDLGAEVARYPYQDEKGAPLYQVVRYEPKTFRQQAADGSWKMAGVRRVPYRLPELVAADPTQPVFIVEGEKDADRLAGLGFVATTNPGGAEKWKFIADEAARVLAGRHVIILPDNDDAGRRHAADVSRALEGHAASVRTLELPDLPPKGDVSDWLSGGGSKERLLDLVAAAPEAASELDGKRIGSLLGIAARQLIARAEGKEKPVPLPLASMNEAMGGGLWPGTYVLVGNTGSGKTQLAMQAAMHAAREGVPVLYIGLEMNSLMFVSRVIGLLSGTPWSRLYLGQEPRIAHTLIAHGDTLGSLPLYFEAPPPHGWTSAEMKAAAESIKRRHPDQTMMVVLDYLQIMSGDSGEPMHERIGRAAYQAVALVQHVGAVVLLVSSTARDKYDALTNKDGKLGDGPPGELVGCGKHSGEIEFSADGVLVLGGKYSPPESHMKLAIAKLRAGVPTWLDLRFNGSRFAEPEDVDGVLY